MKINFQFSNSYLHKQVKFQRQNGGLLIPIIIFTAIALIIITGIMSWTRITIEANRQLITREMTIQLAESGIDYYRWHLAHDKDDFQDGTGNPGPYVHQVLDKDGNIVGEFSLDITPPLMGSTKLCIESTGKVVGSPIERVIRVEMAIPSLAKYAVVAGSDNMRFGEGTEVFGPIHSNQGVRFDGLAHNIVTSALSVCDDPDHTGDNEFAVHTHVNPPPGSGVDDTFRPLEAPPNEITSRSDVFEVGRKFPVPAIDFVGLTNNLATIKTNAQSEGEYFAPSGSQGYQIILNNDDTFDVYKVTSQANPSLWCFDTLGQSGWSTWSIQNKTFIGNFVIPDNGLIFVEDNVWIEGIINTARVTIAAGRFPDNPANRPQIIVNNDLLYTNYDGSDVIALISQGNLNVGLISENDLRIDAALVSQNGRVGRYYYSSFCAPYDIRNSITLYGMIATNNRYGFAYTNGTGYQIRNINYDANLLYGPPPSFPRTSDQYEILSWEEI
ncbi:MAG: hypothetical protein JW740_02525 [Candidatus Zambryskibacteria bacterium]|nr:hypothetical protein [Candidatus Zambryskibacteria bacterium]